MLSYTDPTGGLACVFTGPLRALGHKYLEKRPNAPSVVASKGT